jgi:hypothetical protein
MRPTKRELIWASFVLFAIPILAEIGLRIAHIRFEPELYTPNWARGWTLRPGAEGFVSVETGQFVRINHHGFRDQERSYDKPVDSVRIALLGNSWTEALQVPLEKTYAAVLEQELKERACFPGKHIEVLNFGVAGYSTAQELLVLQQEVWKYRPDMVILVFYSARDISNNVRELNNTLNPEQSPYFIYKNGQLVLDDSFRALPALQQRQIQLQNIRVQITEHLRILQAITALRRFGRMQFALAAARARAEKSGLENLEYSVYAPPSQPAMQKAWQVTEGLLLAMRDEVISHGGEFRIVTLANRPQVIPDPAKRQELAAKLGVPDLCYADKRIDEFGKRTGIPVTNLAPALSKFAETHHAYLNGFNASNFGSGHWNETGHRLAAETIASDICEAVEAHSILVTTP